MTQRSTALVILALMALLFAGGPAETAGGARVEAFNPQGIAKNVRQVTARFSEPMVNFGDPRPAAPFEIKAAVKGQGRWLDERTWVYDFERDLPGAQLCEFRLRPELRSLAGSALAGQRVFSFATGGPEIEATLAPQDVNVIEGDQVFVLRLTAPATGASIMQHAYFTVEGRPERIEARLIEGAERTALLEAAQIKDDELIAVLQARQAFADGRDVSLVWGAGVAAPNGIAGTEDQVLKFSTREPFKASLSGSSERGGYLPVVALNLNFSAAVKADQLAGLELVSATGQVFKPRIEPDETGCVNEVSFAAPLPENMRFQLKLPAGLKDADGRPLANAASFPMPIRTAAAPALAKFSSRFGILEADGAVLPLTVRNIETSCAQPLPAGKPAKASKPSPAKATKTSAAKAPIKPELRFRLYRVPSDDASIIAWLRRVAAAQREKSILKAQAGASEIALPARTPGRQMEVVGVPLERPGLYVAELDSRLLGAYHFAKPAPMYVPTAALVTNLAAHFKWGSESSLVWVTRLSDGRPVAGAQVSIRTAGGKLVWQGKTDSQGLARIAQELKEGPATSFEPNWQEVPQALQSLNSGLFVFARLGGEMSFTHSSWNEGIETWRYQLPEGLSGVNGLTAHTVLDRSLFKTGETVHMLNLMRQTTGQGFSLPDTARLPQEALIEHIGSQQRYRVKLVWTRHGTAACDWQIPAGAKLGSYAISLGKDRQGDSYREIWPTSEFKVSEFRVPLMRAVIKPGQERYVRPQAIELDLGLGYLAGGPAANQTLKLRTQIQERYLSFAGYEQFNFMGGPLKEGLNNPPGAEAEGAPQFETRELKLDAAGAARTQLSDLPAIESPKQLLAEVEYADPNGEVQTKSTRIALYPANYAVGIKTDFWASEAGKTTYQLAALDLNGRPVKNARVTVSLFKQTTLSHRARLVGGLYSYQNTQEIKRIGAPVELTTDSRGLVLNEQACPASGSIIIQAEVKDAQGNTAYANADVYVAGRDEWWFSQGNDDRIDVIPEERRYEPGQTARFQVRMPFRQATALVTVEREGVIDAYVREVSGKDPVVEIPVKAAYAPNVFVSVLAVRGRLGEAKPTAVFDPGKPAFKLGFGEILVGHQAHELKVEVLPEKPSYRVRDNLRVKFRVTRLSDNQPASGGYLSVAAVDEGLLELADNPTWQILAAFMSRRGCAVSTSTAQSMVVGKRHFGLKAVAAGGGGGRQLTRELFDTLLYWQAELKLDERGEASLDIKLNDSLSAFKIVGVATQGAGLFGSGSASITTTQELMLLPGVAPLVREGDHFQAGFTVRNASERRMRVRLELSLTAVAASPKLKPALGSAPQPQEVELEPGQAREVAWEITAPYDAARLDYHLSASAAGGSRDSIRVSQRVVPAVSVRTFQALLRQLGPQTPLELTVALPAGALPGRGGIALSLRPSLRGSLSGVSDYMRAYPYTCLEQRVSRSVALHDKQLWAGIVKDLPSYVDAGGLLKYFPRMERGSDTLTAYVLSVSHQAGYSLPAALRENLLDGLAAFVAGKLRVAGPIEAADTSLRKLAALEAISRYRPVSAEQLSSINLRPADWPTSAVLDLVDILTRNPKLPNRNLNLNAALKVLRTRLTMSGTTMGFSSEASDELWWLMISGDQNCLRAIVSLMPYKAWQPDIPRLVRGALNRLQGGHWDTTPANAWGVLAMDAFARRFEAVPVAGLTTAGFTSPSQVAWQKFPGGADLSWGWAEKPLQLKVSHAGQGAPWVTVTSRAAIPLKQALASGYSLKKTITPVEQHTPGVFSRGDILRVRLDLTAQSDMTWVALNEPIPGGASILNATLAASGDREQGWVWEAYRERSHEGLKVYYEYVPKGQWRVEYTIRLNNAGEFSLPPSRLEALYAPEAFGELPNRPLSIKP